MYICYISILPSLSFFSFYCTPGILCFRPVLVCGLIFENYWSWDKIRIHALGRKFLHNLVQVLFLSAPPSFLPFPCFVYSWCSPQTQKAFYISLPLAICSSFYLVSFFLSSSSWQILWNLAFLSPTRNILDALFLHNIL